MSFYLKLLLIFSFVGQSIAVACVDIIVEHHDARRKVFNASSYKRTLEQDAPEINGHSDKIKGILVVEKNVDINRPATTDEKERIVKAVIAERLIAKKMGMTLGIAKTKDVNPYKDICTDPAKVGHFKVLELTWDLGGELGDYIIAKFNDESIENNFAPENKYTGLFNLLNIKEPLFGDWVVELLAEHRIGLQPEKNIKEQIESFKENIADSYFLRSLAEISSHPLAIFGVVGFTEIKEEPHDAPIKMDFFDSALKGIASHLGISSEEGPLTAGKAYDLCMEIFGEIAANDNHPLSYVVLDMLSSQKDLSDMKLSLIKLFGKEQEEKTRKIVEKRLTGIAATKEHKDQYEAAIHILKKYGFTKESKTITIDALRYIASTKEHKDQYKAAIYILETDDFTKETKTIAMDALKYIANQINHPKQSCALEKLKQMAQDNDNPCRYDAALYFMESHDKSIAIEAFIKIARDNRDHPCRYDAALRLMEAGVAMNSDCGYNITERTWMGGTQVFYTGIELMQITIYVLTDIASQIEHPKQGCSLKKLKQIAQNNDHSLQYDAAEPLLRSEDADDQEIGMEACRNIAQNNGHSLQYYAAEKLLGSEDADDQEIGMEAFRNIAQNNGHSLQYYAAEKLLGSKYADDQKIAMNAFRKIVQNNDHSFQYQAAEWLVDSEDADDQEIGIDVLKQIAQSKNNWYQNKAKEKLAKLEHIRDQAGSASASTKPVPFSKNGQSFSDVRKILAQISQIELVELEPTSQALAP